MRGKAVIFSAKSGVCRTYCEASYQYARCVRVHGSGVRRIMRNLEGFLASADVAPSLVRSGTLDFGRYLANDLRLCLRHSCPLLRYLGC